MGGVATGGGVLPAIPAAAAAVATTLVLVGVVADAAVSSVVAYWVRGIRRDAIRASEVLSTNQKNDIKVY